MNYKGKIINKVVVVVAIILLGVLLSQVLIGLVPRLMGFPKVSLKILAIDERTREPIRHAKVYVFVTRLNKPSKLIAYGETNEDGYAAIEFYLTREFLEKARFNKFVNLFITIHLPGVYHTTRAYSLSFVFPEVSKYLVIPVKKLPMKLKSYNWNINHDKVILKSLQPPLGVPYLVNSDTAHQVLTKVAEIHSCKYASQTITVTQGSYVGVDVLVRYDYETWEVSGGFRISFHVESSRSTGDGNSRDVFRYYTYIYELWYYPDAELYEERVYCDHWEGLLTISNYTLSGDEKLPPYPSDWHYYSTLVEGGKQDSDSRTIQTEKRWDAAATITFPNVGITVSVGVTTYYQSGIKLTITYYPPEGGIHKYYLYDRGEGKGEEWYKWPIVYMAYGGKV